MHNIAHVQAYKAFQSHDSHCKIREKYLQYYVHRTVVIHNAVDYTMRNHGDPEDSTVMAQQQPVLAEDKFRVAYFQSPEKEARNLHTVTSVGKYIKRFWPNLADHTIRDIVALYGPDEVVVLDKMKDMVHAIQIGPYSCMQWKTRQEFEHMIYSPSDCGVFSRTHPYHAYCPTLGWRLVVRRQGAAVIGRALININDKSFVRSYAKPSESSKFSETDQKIEAYLYDLGYEKHRAWPEGIKLLKVDYKNSFVVPFLDPGSGTVDSNGRNLRESGMYLVRDDDGDIIGDCTDGSYSEPESNDDDDEDRRDCDDCGERSDRDDMYYVTRAEERCVCEECFSNYTYVIGRNADRYYIPDDQVISFDGDSYDQEYLSDNNILELENEDYCSGDDACYVQNHGYVHCDNISHKEVHNCDFVKTGTDSYEAVEDCKWCYVNEEWYLEDDMTELTGYWVLTVDLKDHLNEMDLDELEANYPEWEAYFTEWNIYQNANNPAQIVLELEEA